MGDKSSQEISVINSESAVNPKPKKTWFQSLARSRVGRTLLAGLTFGGTVVNDAASPNPVLASRDRYSIQTQILAGGGSYDASEPPVKTQEYPRDFLKQEDLDKYHIKIYSTRKNQGDRNWIGLFVRPEALTKDPLITTIINANDKFESHPNHPAAEANIVLVDIDDLSKEAVVPEEVQGIYDEARKSYETNGIKGVGGFFWDRVHTNKDAEYDLIDKKTGQTYKDSEAKHHKYYIFIATGGFMRPHPSQSMPGPSDLSPLPSEVFTNENFWVKNGVRFGGNLYTTINHPPGEVLRHEVSHVLSPNEVRTDIDGYRKIFNAYWTWQMTGSDSGYWFVFTTPEGPVYTGGPQNAI